MKINVKYQEGRGLDKLVLIERVKVLVGRNLDGQVVHINVPTYRLEWIPF